MHRILIVEDDDDIVNLTTRWLERSRYHRGPVEAAL
jgi:DNA-binding response OmpR family regulator